MGKKKAAALHGISKKERKALEERAAALAAELAEREAKAAKKAGKKKGKKAKAEPVEVTTPELTDTEREVVAAAKAEREAARKRELVEEAETLNAKADERLVPKGKSKTPKAKVADAAEKAKATPSSEGARVAAETAADAAAEAGDEETDAQIKARILAKRAERAAETAPIGGVTSSVEALDAIVDPGLSDNRLAAVKAAVKNAKATAAAIVEVETERGREFVTDAPVVPGGVDPIITDEALDELIGRPAADDFAKPSEAPRDDFEVNGNGQYKIQRLSDGKVVGYTRATTYISNLEDRTNLEKWKLRMLLEGVAINDHPDDNGRIDDPTVARMRDLIHRRDVAIAKARKADRKGKLGAGELATYVDGAWSDFKKAVNALAEELLEVGGVHEKAQKGTDIHALTELHDREGIDAVGDLLTEGKISPADLADVEAYAAAIKRAGIRILGIEQAIVVEELKVAGRLDRIVLAKLPGMQRATRMVLDIKTGRVDLGAGKIAQQLEMYSRGEGYDLDTHERTDLKLSRTKALLVHVPAGTGTATVHVVDLTLGRKGNALSGAVREWRNEGKRAIDLKTDLAAVTA
jgi:hypothetical protein